MKVLLVNGSPHKVGVKLQNRKRRYLRILSDNRTKSKDFIILIKMPAKAGERELG